MNHTEHKTHHSSYHRRLHSKKHIITNFKTEANQNRTFSEKIADLLTIRLGSMIFLVTNFFFFTIWIAINVELLPVQTFDPFPFGFLTLVVSLEAIFLAIVVLISQNRAAKIDDLREEIALQIDTIAEEEITKMIELQILILKKQGVDVSKDPEIQEMLQPTDPETIKKVLEEEEEHQH